MDQQRVVEDLLFPKEIWSIVVDYTEPFLVASRCSDGRVEWRGEHASGIIRSGVLGHKLHFQIPKTHSYAIATSMVVVATTFDNEFGCLNWSEAKCIFRNRYSAQQSQVHRPTGAIRFYGLGAAGYKEWDGLSRESKELRCNCKLGELCNKCTTANELYHHSRAHVDRFPYLIVSGHVPTDYLGVSIYGFALAITEEALSSIDDNLYRLEQFYNKFLVNSPMFTQ